MTKAKSKPNVKTTARTAKATKAAKLASLLKLDTVAIMQKIGLFVEEPTQKVIKILERQKAIPEEKIAELMKIKINQSRRLLYDLMEKGITTYEKKKDKKKKWWYIYFWSLDREKIGGMIKTFKLKELEKKRRELGEERKYEFECKTCNKKFLHEDALESEYLCPQCGSALEPARTSSTIRKLEIEIRRLENEILKIDELQRQ